MTFTLTIHCDNSSFDDLSLELSRLLATLAQDLGRMPVGEGAQGDVRDVNGNPVGEWTIAEEPMPATLRQIAVPIEEMYHAWLALPSAGEYMLDQSRFDTFQAGWHAALDWVNAQARQTPTDAK